MIIRTKKMVPITRRGSSLLIFVCMFCMHINRNEEEGETE